MPLDPQLLDELARCFMRAALDDYLRTLEVEPAECDRTQLPVAQADLSARSDRTPS